MIVGVPKELKTEEYRVAMTPAGVEMLARDRHQVLVEKGAGEGSGFRDEDFVNAGARIVPEARAVWGEAELIVKVKEPQGQEFPLLREGLMIFTYLHLASDKSLTEGLMSSGCIAIGYETVDGPDGGLPLLEPMSEVAGRMSVLEGAKHLQRPHGGSVVLISGVPGVKPAKVTVIGGGTVGMHAARLAAQLQADVVILEKKPQRMRYLDDVMPANVKTLYSNPLTLRDAVRNADLVIGAVLLPGAKAPVLVNHDDLRAMRPGSVLVDVSIDQGGCAETSRPTTHNDPVFTEHGVVHYCVSNMPGAVPRTSTLALTSVTLPYIQELANRGLDKAIRSDPGLANGINVMGGKVRDHAVAEAHGLEDQYEPLMLEPSQCAA